GGVRSPARHALFLDWRVRRPRALLLPHLQSSRAHRIRPPARNRLCERRTHARSYPHGRAHPERQRLRQGLAAPALRATIIPTRGARTASAKSSVNRPAPVSLIGLLICNTFPPKLRPAIFRFNTKHAPRLSPSPHPTLS